MDGHKTFSMFQACDKYKYLYLYYLRNRLERKALNVNIRYVLNVQSLVTVTYKIFSWSFTIKLPKPGTTFPCYSSFYGRNKGGASVKVFQ